MIVTGIDPHMKTHTAVAVAALTGARLGMRPAWRGPHCVSRACRRHRSVASGMTCVSSPTSATISCAVLRRSFWRSQATRRSPSRGPGCTRRRWPTWSAHKRGMSYREALRCLKRLIARAVFRAMLRAEKAAAGTVVRADFGAAPVALAV